MDDTGLKNRDMKITFGMDLDGVDWSFRDASLGELNLGPQGLLSLLETQLGLTGIEVHPAVRINEYLKRLESNHKPGCWYHGSFKADSWSTAKQLLAWRDSLVEAGWNESPLSTSSPRLRALSELEQVNIPLSPGRADRLSAVIRQLHKLPLTRISELILRDSKELLPSTWKKLIDALSKKGILIKKYPSPLPAPHKSNLAAIQAFINKSESGFQFDNKDKSILQVLATDEWEAAENLAVWLAAGQKHQNIAIICSSNTAILDQALKKLGLPTLGRSESSRWRAALQILPLMMANVWEPLNIMQLSELLTSPLSPVSAVVARELMNALKEEPGVGGEAWEEALDNLTQAGIEEDIIALDAVLTKNRYSPEDGVPGTILIERCNWLINRLAKHRDDSPVKEVTGQVRELQQLVRDKKSITRVTLDRMLDSIIGTGKPSPEITKEAGSWQIYTHPGQILQPVDTVIWWKFVEPKPSTVTHWTNAEIIDLQKSEILPEKSKNFRKRDSLSWTRALMAATKQFLMFFPDKIQGEKIYPHPLWDEICNAVLRLQPGLEEGAVHQLLTIDCKNLYRDGHWKLSDRQIKLPGSTLIKDTPVKTGHTLPKNSLFPPKSLSFSQMGTLIGCPMKWALQYQTELKLPEAMAIPTGNKMIGTLCHKIIELIYANVSPQPDPEQASGKAALLYDQLLPSMASELLLEGNELENIRYRSAVKHAVKSLAEEITRLGLTVKNIEEKLESEMDGIPFKGFADMILLDSRGQHFILDLKWSNSDKYKKEEVKEGNALQLAVYTWLLQPKASRTGKIQSGYFMLAQGSLLSDSTLLGDEALEVPFSSEEIWMRGKQTWGDGFEKINWGLLEASGVMEHKMISELDSNKEKVQTKLKTEAADEGLLYQSPPCNFCDFGVLCGLPGDKK